LNEAPSRVYEEDIHAYNVEEINFIMDEEMGEYEFLF